MTINLIGTGLKRDPQGIVTAADSLRARPATLNAFLITETSGSGFDSQKRLKALFEPHRFYAELKAAPDKLKKAVAAGLAYPTWGEKPYPKDSYARIAAAMAIDETAALRATSWALPQILGSNCVRAAFPTPQAMIAAMLTGEDAQVLAFFNFIKTDPILLKATQENDFDKMAERYNGKKFRIGGYGVKIRSNYEKRPASEKVLAIYPTPGPIAAPQPANDEELVPAGLTTPTEDDTPPTPAAAPAPEPVAVPIAPAAPEPIATPAPSLADTPTDPILQKVQQQLSDAGYPVGNPDGKWGEMTRTALAGFKAAYNETTTEDLAPDSSYGPDVQLALLNWKRPVAPERAAATAGDLIAAGDRQAKLYTRIRNYVGIGGTALTIGTASGVPDQIKKASDQYIVVRDALQPFAPLAELALRFWWVFALAGFGWIIWWGGHRLTRSVEDYRAGKRA